MNDWYCASEKPWTVAESSKKNIRQLYLIVCLAAFSFHRRLNPKASGRAEYDRRGKNGRAGISFRSHRGQDGNVADVAVHTFDHAGTRCRTGFQIDGVEHVAIHQPRHVLHLCVGLHIERVGL